MFVDYYPGKTLLHRLDVRAKLAAFTALMVLLFFFTNPLYNLFLALFGIFLLFYLGLTHLNFKADCTDLVAYSLTQPSIQEALPFQRLSGFMVV